MIDTIIFDIGNVLTDFCWKEYFDSLGYTSNMVMRLANASVLSSDWKELDLGNLPYSEILDLFIENDPDIEKEIRAALTDLGPILSKKEYAIPWLKELKQKGYRLLYLSNFSEKVLAECAPAMDFLPFMDGGVFSFRVHVIKPDPAIYKQLLQTYSLEPSSCVFLDDLKENVNAAKKLGIHGIVFENLTQAKEELFNLGIH